MGEPQTAQTQDQAHAEQGAAPQAAGAATAHHPIVSMVETMISAGKHSPAELAQVLLANHAVQHDLLALLHRLLGNSIVQSIMALVTGGGAGPQPDETKAPDATLGPVRVTARRLRVRRSPTTKEDNIVGSLHAGTIVTALAHEGAWVRIEHNGETVYIHGDYTERVDAPPTKGKPDARPSSAGEDEDGDAAVTPVPAPTPVIAGPATPTPTPTPTPKPAPAPEPKTPEPAPVTPDVKGEAPKQFFEKVYTAGAKSVGFQQVQVFASPGGITATPDVFIHFHGHRANYKLEGGPEDQTKKQNATLSGVDVAEQAMRQAQNQNTIAILPQGVIAENEAGTKNDGGYMAALQQGLPTFLDQVLKQVGADLQIADLKPGHIGISGHSAGGYAGVHDALSKAGELADAITDITLMDTSYADVHFADTAKWMYAGKPGKNVRIIGTRHQITDKESSAHLWGYFSKAKLEKNAKAHGFTVEDVGGEGEKRDAEMSVVQHSRLKKGGDTQADILILQYVKTGNASKDHAPLRDEVMDDAIFSIGEGAAGNDTFGKRDRGVLAGEAHDDDHDDAHDDKQAVPPPAPVPAPAPEPKVGDTVTGKDAEPEKEAPKEKAKVKDPPKKEKPKKEKPKKDAAVDEYGNPTERSDDRTKNQVGDRTFTNSFTVVRTGKLYDRKGKKLKETLPIGAEVHVGDMSQSRVQIITAEHTAKDDIWIDFSSLGGRGESDVGLGNEKSDPEDKQRADKIREGLPEGRTPGKSQNTWRFSSKFKPSLDGVALDGSLMSKVHALMEWAIANDMVVGDIVIGSGMRPPKSAHYMCVRYELASLERRNNISMASLQALPGGRDEDGNKWYEPGWTKEQVIEYAKQKLKDEGASGKPAAAGYNFGDSRRHPLNLNAKPGVSRHCSGHAVDVDIPWRSDKDPKKSDVWGWEHIYHQFGLTRPLHRDRASAADEESWHIEETGKDLAVEGEEHDG